MCRAAGAAAGLNIPESARVWSLLGLGDTAIEMSQSFCLKESPCWRLQLPSNAAVVGLLQEEEGDLPPSVKPLSWLCLEPQL